MIYRTISSASHIWPRDLADIQLMPAHRLGLLLGCSTSAPVDKKSAGILSFGEIVPAMRVAAPHTKGLGTIALEAAIKGRIPTYMFRSDRT